jgi:hypothetical protein
MSDKKDQFVGVRLPRSLVERLKAQAKSERRSMSSYIEQILHKGTADIPDPPPAPQQQQLPIQVQETPQPYQTASPVARIFAAYDLQDLSKASGHPLEWLFDVAKGKRKMDDGDINMLARGMSADHIRHLRALIAQPHPTLPLGLPHKA